MRRGDPEAWRAWSRDAPPELLAAFSVRAAGVMEETRKVFPPDCTAGTPAYEELKHLIRLALTGVACDLEEERNAVD